MMQSHSKVSNGWNVAVEAASIKQSRKWPELNTEEHNAAIRRYGECWSLADLLNSSESWPDDIACRQTEWLIDQLFPGNPRLSCGKSKHEISARSREDWRGHLAQQQFIVANTSRPRRFLVCAFDHGAATQQASMLKSLSELAPLVCVVHSGISSLEGWFFVQSLPKKRVRTFFGYATSVGANPANWPRSQPVRMPGGLRDGGLRQRIYHLNLQALRNEQWAT
jgi:hypothetical protein|tara:strand:- start:124 stop:792 length:669 start_codon:yes stop_codon:yes gene_type:complete